MACQCPQAMKRRRASRYSSHHCARLRSRKYTTRHLIVARLIARGGIIVRACIEAALVLKNLQSATVIATARFGRLSVTASVDRHSLLVRSISNTQRQCRRAGTLAQCYNRTSSRLQMRQQQSFPAGRCTEAADRKLGSLQNLAMIDSASSSKSVWTHRLSEGGIPVPSPYLEKTYMKAISRPSCKYRSAIYPGLGCISSVARGLLLVDITPFGRALIEACTR
jgi:hypothetical protein